MNYKSRKVNKKQKRCETIIQNDCGVQSSKIPTKYLAILNAGLATGLTEEQVLIAANLHGEVMQLLMLPGKSYCFLQCTTIANAQQIFSGMHNVAKIGQNGATVFLTYIKELPPAAENCWQKPLPNGLFLVPDFVTCEEEKNLLSAVGVQNAEGLTGELKHRRVKHFGYEFLYGVNNVDPSQPLEQEIPVACQILWTRLKATAKTLKISMDWEMADQLTVNEYEPGQGIPPHVDTHSAFLDPILSLSLQGDIVMEFRKGNERIPIVVPRRSLLIMSGEARYDWMHGITPRNMDVVPTDSGTLTTKVRTKRTSLTFRHLRRDACKCNFPMLCDTRRQELETKKSVALIEGACHLEETNVHNVYEKIANHFSETRHTPWPHVATFLNSFESGAIVIDIGCGNGKYLNCNENILTIGCDRSYGLLNVCISKTKNVFRCDCLNVPIRSNSVDGCISIAVIHHLATAERRLDSIREMARLLRKGGRALVYVWAKNQRNDAKKSSYLLQNKAVNKHKITEEQQRQITEQQFQTPQINDTSLPIHTNRTEFLQQDVLVPWKLKNTKSEMIDTQAETFLRYYHVFEESELEALVAKVVDVELVKSYYDQGNHCVIFQKK